MKWYKSWSLIPVTIYTLLCISAVAYTLLANIVSDGGAELAGLSIFVVGLPWSLLFGFIVIAIGGSSAWLFVIILVLSCMINGTILFKAGAKWQQ